MIELDELLEKVKKIKDRRMMSQKDLLLEMNISWPTWEYLNTGVTMGSVKTKRKMMDFIRSNAHVLKDDFSLLKDE